MIFALFNLYMPVALEIVVHIFDNTEGIIILPKILKESGHMLLNISPSKISPLCFCL